MATEILLETEMNLNVNQAPLPTGDNAAPVPDATSSNSEPLGPKTELAMKLANSAPMPTTNQENAAPIPANAVISQAPELKYEEEKQPLIVNYDKPTELLLDLGQQINQETLSNLGENDPKWSYNMTLGDIAKYNAPTIADQEKRAEYWFALEGKGTRKVFISGKIKRLSEINPAEESFRVSLYILMYWYITHADYMDYLIFKKHNSTETWTPSWFPSISLPNAIETTKSEFFTYPNRGQFPVLIVKGLGLGKQLNLEKQTQDSITNRSVVCKGKFEVSAVFCEELELKNFPFDVQPLTISVNSKNDPDDRTRAVFLPALRKSNFFSFDPKYSVYSEWDLDRFHVEFGDRDAKIKGSKSRSSDVSAITVRIIVKRRWNIYAFRSFLVIAVIDLLGLSGFVIDSTWDRLELLLALLLTIVVAMQELLNEPRMTFLGKYGLSGFMYLVLLTAEATFLDYFDEDIDKMFLYIFGIGYVINQLFWVMYAICARKDEIRRSYNDEDALQEASHNVRLVSKWQKAERKGKNDRLLSFVSEKWVPKKDTDAKK